MSRDPTDLERFRDALVGVSDAETCPWVESHSRDLNAALAELRTPESDGDGDPPAPPRRSRRRWNILPLLFLPAAGVVAGVAIYQLHFAPLLYDDFRDGWYDVRLWEHPPEIKGAGLKEEMGYLKLVNRGALVTRNEYPTPVEVTVRWKWINLGLNPNYADHLTIVTRTRGKMSTERPWESLDGVQVRLFANGGGIAIQEPGESPTVIPPGHYLAVPMPADEWVTVRATDDGKRVRVYLSGPGVDTKFERVPIYEKELSTPGGGNRIAIYNREFVAYPHESHLDLVRIDRMRE